MTTNKDVLEILEFIQLQELKEAGMLTDPFFKMRLQHLSVLISKEDVESISKKWGEARPWLQSTGFAKKQRCTNKNCKHVFVSEDISELCDICYHATLRIADD